MRIDMALLLAGCAVGALADTAVIAQTVAPAPVATDRQADAARSPVQTADEQRKEEPVDGEDVIVTGTRIVRPNMTSNAPVTVIDSEFLRQRGLGRIEEALAQMPQVTPMLGAQGTGWTAGRAEIGLRRLGAGRTLTLLNGQRIFNDANLVPGALIDRIDILTGGASAVYGSDAIAGVVNFIVKRRFEGVVLDAEVSAFTHRNDNELLLRETDRAGYRRPAETFVSDASLFGSIAAGKNLFEDRVNISGFVTYREDAPIRLGDIDTTACELAMNRPGATVFRNDTFACQLTPYEPNNRFNIGAASFATAPDGSRAWVPFDPSLTRNIPRDDYIQRNIRNITAGGFLSADLFANMRLNANFIWNRSEQQARIVPEGGVFQGAARVNCDNPLMSEAQARLICGANFGTTNLSAPFQAIGYRERFEQVMNPGGHDWRAAGSLSGPLVDTIRFEASYQRSRNIFRNNNTRAYEWEVAQLFQRGLQVRNVNGMPTCLSRIDGTDPNCVPIDIFAGNPFENDAVFDYLTGPGSARQQNDLEVFNLLVSGTLETYGIRSPFAESGVGFAIIAEQRNDRFQSTGAGVWRNFNVFDGRTRVREIAAEIDIPLIQDVFLIDDLTINGGYRLSDYSTYDRLVHTWKGEVSYQPFSSARFRASVNRAIRVPVQQRLEGENRYQNVFFTDLCAPPGPAQAGLPPAQRFTFEQCARGGMTRQQYDALTNYGLCNGAGQCPATLINGGRADLGPERSISYTAGAVFQPSFIPGLTGSVDYFDIDIEGAFEWARWWLAFDQCYNNSVQVFCDMYVRDPNSGQLQEVDARWANSGFSRTRGVDFALNYLLDPNRLGIANNAGTFNLSFNGTLTTGYDVQFAEGNTPWSCLGYHSFNCGQPMPRWRSIAGVTWVAPEGGASFNLSWRYIGGTQVSRFSDNPVLRVAPTATDPQTFPLIGNLPAISYFDVAANIPITPMFSLRFNMQNMFDKDPPLIGQDRFRGTGGLPFNTYPALYEIRGRTVRLGVTARF